MAGGQPADAFLADKVGDKATIGITPTPDRWRLIELLRTEGREFQCLRLDDDSGGLDGPSCIFKQLSNKRHGLAAIKKHRKVGPAP